MTIAANPSETVSSRFDVTWMSRVQWASVTAGTFATLACFVVSALLARAVGIDWTFRTAASSGESAGAVIWGGVAGLISFAIGGWMAGGVAKRGPGWLQGLTVWAVATPILVFLLGAGLSPMLGKTASMEPGVGMQPQSERNLQTPSEVARITPTDTPTTNAAQTAAWWGLASVCAGFIGAVGGGAAAGGRPS